MHLSHLVAPGPPSFQRGLPVPRPRGAPGFALGEGQASRATARRLRGVAECPCGAGELPPGWAVGKPQGSS